MKLKQRQINSMYELLLSLENRQTNDGEVISDKNTITDRKVRAAVIDNIIALDAAYTTFRKNLSILNGKYFTDTYRQLLGRRRAETDPDKIMELEALIDKEYKTFSEDYSKSLNKLLDKETDIDLVKIDRKAFDEATEGIPVSMMVYIRLKELFK